MINKKLDEYKKLLIVVDMVNGFVKEGVMADQDIMRIVPIIKNLIEETLDEKETVFFIKDTHTEEASEFKTFPKHCLKKTKESELIEEFKKYEHQINVKSFEKNSTSTMYAPGFLENINQLKNLREIIVTGCCTDICDLNLVIPLQNYFNQINRDVLITVPVNAVETYNSETHPRDEYNEIAFKLMRQAGINLVKRYGGKRK